MDASFRLGRFLREVAERISRAVHEVDTAESDPLDMALRGFTRSPGGLLNVVGVHEAGPGPKTEVSEYCLLAADWPESEDEDPLYWRLRDEQDVDRTPKELTSFVEVGVHSKTGRLRCLSVVLHRGETRPLTALSTDLPLMSGDPEFRLAEFPEPGWACIDYVGPCCLEFGEDSIRVLFGPDAPSAICRGIAAPRFTYWLDQQGRLLAVEATAIQPHQLAQFHATSATERRDDESA